jgi:FkbM family methyltransferase
MPTFELSFKSREGTWDLGIVREELDQYRLRDYKNIKKAIDIGAHIGGTALYLAHRGTEVIAIEPNKENYDLLVENIKLNGLGEKVKPYNVAISDKKGKTILYSNTPNTGGNSIVIKKGTESEVETTTIDEFLTEEIDLLKMDCEGSEYEIIMGLNDFSKIRNIVAELHFEYPKQKEIIEKLKRYYYVEVEPDNKNDGDRIIYCTRLK